MPPLPKNDKPIDITQIAQAGEALLLQYFAGDFHAIFRL